MSSPDLILVDTHVLLWWKSDATRLSSTVADILRAGSRILISPITFWEVAMLVAKQRVCLDRPTREWARDVLAEARVELAGFDATVAMMAAELPAFHGDPADRFLVATARHFGVPLLSKDRLIHAHADDQLRVLW